MIYNVTILYNKKGNKMHQVPKNRSRIGATVCAILSGLGFIGFVVPLAVADQFDYAPLIFLGFFLFLSFFIAYLLVRKNAVAFDKLMSGEELIAYWQ